MLRSNIYIRWNIKTVCVFNHVPFLTQGTVTLLHMSISSEQKEMILHGAYAQTYSCDKRGFEAALIKPMCF